AGARRRARRPLGAAHPRPRHREIRRPRGARSHAHDSPSRARQSGLLAARAGRAGRAVSPEPKAISVHELLAMKERGERIVCLTCYDALFARLLDESGADILLVGDSVNQVLAGAETTLSATREQIIYHTTIVRPSAVRALAACDMPFLPYSVCPPVGIPTSISG